MTIERQEVIEFLDKFGAGNIGGELYVSDVPAWPAGYSFDHTGFFHWKCDPHAQNLMFVFRRTAPKDE